jgi:hypothetical protein
MQSPVFGSVAAGATNGTLTAPDILFVRKAESSFNYSRNQERLI